VDVSKDFISKNKNSLVLQPKYDVLETVTQVEILIQVFMHPELDKCKVEEYTDEFLNSWIRLKDGLDLEAYDELLVKEFAEKAVGLVRDNYPLLGSWCKVRRMTLALMKMISDNPAKFDFQTKITSFL